MENIYQDRKAIEGFPAYSLQEDGSVWTRWERGGRCGKNGLGRGFTLGEVWRKMKPPINTQGYRTVYLSNALDKPRRHKVARLICIAYHGKPLPGHVTRHKDGTRTNDTPDNLEWGTAAENSQDRKRHGTYYIGESHPSTKVSDADILQIRSMFPEHTMTKIASVFKCSIGYIHYVLRNKTRQDETFITKNKKHITITHIRSEHRVKEFRDLFCRGWSESRVYGLIKKGWSACEIIQTYDKKYAEMMS